MATAEKEVSTSKVLLDRLEKSISYLERVNMFGERLACGIRNYQTAIREAGTHAHKIQDKEALGNIGARYQAVLRRLKKEYGKEEVEELIYSILNPVSKLEPISCDEGFFVPWRRPNSN